ncbi:integrase, catalytic region, zinc finger, CCHC-type containing protein [Tanacetum coccineum]
MSNTNTNLQTQTSSVLYNDTDSLCSTSKVQEKTQLSRSRCINSLKKVKSQFKFLSESLQIFGAMPIFKRTFSQDLDLLEQHLTKDILSQTDCKTTLTKLITKFENAFNSELKELLSKEDLKCTRIEHGFKRAFMSLFGQDNDTFTSKMFLNVDQLQKQLDKDDFQEDGSMAAFWVINRQFQKFIDLKFTLDYDKDARRGKVKIALCDEYSAARQEALPPGRERDWIAARQEDLSPGRTPMLSFHHLNSPKSCRNISANPGECEDEFEGRSTTLRVTLIAVIGGLAFGMDTLSVVSEYLKDLNECMDDGDSKVAKEAKLFDALEHKSVVIGVDNQKVTIFTKAPLRAFGEPFMRKMVNDVNVEIHGVKFKANFVVLDYVNEGEPSIMFGRDFLVTTKSQVDFGLGEIRMNLTKFKESIEVIDLMEEEVEHRLFKVYFGKLEVDDKQFDYKDYWTRVGHYVTKIACFLGYCMDDEIKKCSEPIDCEYWTSKMLADELDEENTCLKTRN